MEYFNVVANYTGSLTFMWSGKFNNNSLESQEKSGNFYYQTEWEPCNSLAELIVFKSSSCQSSIIYN